MRLKTKFSLEVILLVGLIGMVSVIAISNTVTVQDSFLDLSSETLPTWDALKDMRLAASLVSSNTVEIVLIQDDLFDDEISSEAFALEEQLEYEKGYKPGGASRLSCQISLTPELDGLILHLRPDELL